MNKKLKMNNSTSNTTTNINASSIILNHHGLSNNKHYVNDGIQDTHPKEYRTAISCFIIFGFTLWFSIEIGCKLSQERRKRHAQEKNRERIKRQLITKKVTNCPHEEKLLSISMSLKKSDLIENNGDDDVQTCLICLEPFKEGDDVTWSKTSTACNHVYHKACITPWLINHNDCPCCRSMFIQPWSIKSCYHPIGDKYDEKIETNRSNLTFCKRHGLVVNCHDFASYSSTIEKSESSKTDDAMLKNHDGTCSNETTKEIGDAHNEANDHVKINVAPMINNEIDDCDTSTSMKPAGG